MTGEQIYNTFKRELDGEEFASDEDALDAMNIAYRAILAERVWEFLKKSYTLPAGTYDLSAITDFDVVLAVWEIYGSNPTDKEKLEKASFDNRYSEGYDYWIDLINRTIEMLNQSVINSLLVDYKYRPEDLTMETSPVFPSDYAPIIAYKMILDFKESDQDFDGYNEVSAKYARLKGLLVDYNEGLKTYA